MNWKIVVAIVIVAAVIYVAYASLNGQLPPQDQDQNSSADAQMAYGFNPTQAECEKQIEFYDEDHCWQLYAQNSNNPEFCRKIFMKGVKDICYWNIAVQSGDKELCNSVEDADLRYGCIEEIELG